MDEGYAVIRPWTIWRRRLFVGVIILAFLALVWVAEVLYDNWRVNSGPSAWFSVVTPVTRRAPYAAHESVSSDGYATERDCNNALRESLRATGGSPAIASCQRLLLTDAAQMRQY